MYKIKDFPSDERPRERLLKNGASSLSNAELLAIILRCGSRNNNVIDLSKSILKQNNLKSLSRKRINELKNLNGIGMAKACQIVACFELGRRLAGFNEEQKPTLSNAKDVVDIFMPEMSTQNKEYFIGAFLDTRKRLINSETIFVGSLNASIVHPREIFRSAIEEGAAAIILLHNHPSGNPEPSKEDILTTKQLIKAGNLIGIEVLDHIIIGNKDYFSFKENDYF